MNTVYGLAALSCAVLCGAAHAQAGASDDGGVTPYRPSVSTPAQLPRPGQLEMELGGLSAHMDDSRRDSLPYTFKLAFNEAWGVLVEGDGYVSERDDGAPRSRGLGDTTLVLKRAFIIDDATAFGLELGAKLPTAKDSLGSGKTDYSLNGIFSRDLASVHMDLNVNLTRLGAVDDGSGRIQRGAAASFSTPVNEQWGATAELSGTQLRGAASTAQLLAAATYSPSKRLVIDFGMAKGLNAASPNWAFFTGVVTPLGRLW